MVNRYPILAFLLICSLLQGCYKESNYDPSKISQYDTTIHLFSDYAMIPADSVSVDRVIVELPWDADSNKSTVLVRTDLGTFVESGNQSVTITAKQNGDSAKRIGIATLKSGSVVGRAHIQCVFSLLTMYLSDSFSIAYPDFLNLSASSLSVKPADSTKGEVTFTCKLYKQSGIPSQRNNVTMVVKDSSFNVIGSFRVYNNLSDNTGTTQYTYVLGDSLLDGVNYYGLLYAIASCPKNGGGLASDTLKLISLH